MIHVLVVENDSIFNHGVAATLKQEGYAFWQAFSIATAETYLRKRQFDLILLGIDFPDGNGFDFCQTIRKHSSVPIIFLSDRSSAMDEAAALLIGGDDYLKKPCNPLILKARINVALRRQNDRKNMQSFCIDDFLFDFESMEFRKNGQEIVLSKTEQKLLKILISHQGMILPRNKLVDKIWMGGAEYVDGNALSVTVNRLRNKLEDHAGKPQYIHTVYGVGYLWENRPCS